MIDLYVILNTVAGLPRTETGTRQTRTQTPMQTMNTRQINASDCPSQVVINVVAAYSNRPVLDLEPLYNTIDPEALDRLVKDRSDVCVAFEYQDFSVTVDSERVCVEE